MKYTVLRAFLLAGERQEVDREVDIDDVSLAAGLKHAGKIAPAGGAPAPAVGPMTTESAGALAGRGSRKSKKD